MKIRGRCENIGDRNEKTGIISLSLKDFSSGETIQAMGPLKTVRENRIYILDGNFMRDGTFRFGKSRRSADGKNESIDIITDSHAGISRELAKKIVETCGDDIFEYPEIPGTAEKMKEIPGCGEKTAKAVMETARAETNENYAFLFLSENNVPYSVILNYLRDFPKASERSISKAPYKLMDYGADFTVCDEIARKNGSDSWSMERTRAAIAQSVKDMGNAGHTREEAGKFAARCLRRLSHGGEETDIPSKLMEWAVLSDGNIRFYISGENTYVSPFWAYRNELDIISGLRKIQNTAVSCDTDIGELVRKVSAVTGITYNTEQEEAFRILKNGGVLLLTGGPGTGKTTTIGGIVCAYRLINPDAKILLCAPTGRAASRMAEIAGATAMTMHKAMNMKWYKNGTKPDRLDYDLIITDEMSMCDTELMAAFVNSVRSGAPVLFSGDDNQLPSVGPGQVFRDMLDSGKFDTVRLEHTIRQSEESLIVKNSENLLKGLPFEFGNNFAEIDAGSNEDVRKYLDDMIKGTDSPEDLPQILIPIKGGKAGTREINLYVQALRNFTDTGKYIDGTVYHEGDRVIMGANRYDIGYMNGDTGVIEKITEESLTIRFPDKKLTLSTADLTDMALSYALTIHKAQGSECDEAVIILPKGSERMASRELIYTAITRAKKKVTIINVNGNLHRFTKSVKRTNRNCGLCQMLRDEIYPVTKRM